MGVPWSCWECLERFDPYRSIAIGNGCIWGKLIFLATGRPGDCMEMLLECLRNPGYRLGIVTGLQQQGSWETLFVAGFIESLWKRTTENSRKPLRIDEGGSPPPPHNKIQNGSSRTVAWRWRAVGPGLAWG
eukprot:Gb_34313 [translate_table: standard]